MTSFTCTPTVDIHGAIHPKILCDREFLTHLLCHRGKYRSDLWKQGLDNSCLINQREGELKVQPRYNGFLLQLSITSRPHCWITHSKHADICQ